MDLLNETALLKTKTHFKLIDKEETHDFYAMKVNLTRAMWRTKYAILAAMLYSGFISCTILTISIQKSSRIPLGCIFCVFARYTTSVPRLRIISQNGNNMSRMTQANSR